MLNKISERGSCVCAVVLEIIGYFNKANGNDGLDGPANVMH